MQRMIRFKKWFLQRLKKAFESLESTIFSLLWTSLILSSVSSVFSEKVRNFFFKILNTATPIWAIIIVVLFFLYIYSRADKSHASNTPETKIEYHANDGRKWETHLKSQGGSLSVSLEEYPWCLEHGLRFYFHQPSVGCPKYFEGHCTQGFLFKDFEHVRKKDKSYIDKKIRDNQ